METLTYKSNTTSIHGLARYYFGNWKARPYVNFMTGYTWNRALTMSQNGELVRFRGDEGWNASLGAGVAYFVAPKVALEADANYRHHFNDDLGRRNNRAVTLRLGLSLYLR
jgi:outer membrane protein W